MPFHRYTTPSYGLLGGAFPGVVGATSYDYLNVLSGGIGGGDGSANANGAKVGGPNAGTYLVAFGEDATSSFANRGMRALGENTDMLDDVARGNIPNPNYEDFTPGTPTVNYVITADMFVGDDSSIPVEALAQVVGVNDQIIRDSGSGEVVTVVDVDDGIGGSVIGNGFQAGARVILSHAIDEGDGGGAVRIMYGSRTSAARAIETPDRDMAFGLAMRAFRRALIVEAFKYHGLNEKYRRATAAPPSALSDTPGDGARILRDGQAVTAYPETFDFNSAPPAGAYPDPWMALWLADHVGGAPASLTDTDNDGHVGYLAKLPHRLASTPEVVVNDSGEPMVPGRFHAGYLEVVPQNVEGTTVLGSGVVTRLKYDTPGSVSGSTLTVSAPYFVGTSAPLATAITINEDYVEVDFGSGDKRVFIINAVNIVENKLTLTTLGRSEPSLPPQSVTFTWYQGITKTGPHRGLYYGVVRSVAGIASSATPARVYSDLSSGVALYVGDHDRASGLLRNNLSIFGDGSAQSVEGVWQHSVQHRYRAVTVASGSYILTINPAARVDVSTGAGYSALVLSVTSPSVSNLNIISVSTLKTGLEFVLAVRFTGPNTVNMNWDSRFVFSSPGDGSLGPGERSTGPHTVLWRGTTVGLTSGVRWLVQRVGDYKEN